MSELERLVDDPEAPAELRALFGAAASDGVGSAAKDRIERTLARAPIRRARRWAAAVLAIAAAVALFVAWPRASEPAIATITPEPSGGAPGLATSETLTFGASEPRDRVEARLRGHTDALAVPGPAAPVRWRRLSPEEVAREGLYVDRAQVHYVAPALASAPVPDESCFRAERRRATQLSPRRALTLPAVFMQSRECLVADSERAPRFHRVLRGLAYAIETDVAVWAPDFREVYLSFLFDGQVFGGMRADYDPEAREVTLLVREQRSSGWFGTALTMRLGADGTLAYVRTEAR